MEEKDINLTKKQKRLLQIGVVILLVLFIVGFFFFTQNKKVTTPKLKNTTVYLQDSTLQVFDDAYSFVYPDRISLHYPYLLVIKPSSSTTYVYDLDQKKKEKELKNLALDYTDNSILYNQGKTTYLNNKDLGFLCEKGFIKSDSEILCITKSNKDAVQNMLISINPKTLKYISIYSSQGILSDVKVINNKIYLGEINTNTNQNRVLIDNQPIDVPDIVSTIYQMNNGVYFASYKSVFNNNTLSYYLIEGNKASKQEGNRPYFLK